MLDVQGTTFFCDWFNWLDVSVVISSNLAMMILGASGFLQVLGFRV